MLCPTVKAGNESLTCNKNSVNSSTSPGPEDLLLLPDLPAQPAPVPAGVGTPCSPPQLQSSTTLSLRSVLESRTGKLPPPCKSRGYPLRLAPSHHCSARYKERPPPVQLLGSRCQSLPAKTFSSLSGAGTKQKFMKRFEAFFLGKGLSPLERVLLCDLWRKSSETRHLLAQAHSPRGKLLGAHFIASSIFTYK